MQMPAANKHHKIYNVHAEHNLAFITLFACNHYNTESSFQKMPISVYPIVKSGGIEETGISRMRHTCRLGLPVPTYGSGVLKLPPNVG